VAIGASDVWVGRDWREWTRALAGLI